ncbi:MAG TPA: hypothetical protein VGA69_12925 [Nitriliruptorales bacterium]
MRTHSNSLIAVTAIAGLIGTACAASDAPTPEPAAAQPAAAQPELDADERPVDFVGKLALDPTSGPAGTDVTITGEDLPADTELELLWVGADCDWVLQGEQREEYHGRQCAAREDPIGSVTTDGSGHLSVSFAVPQGYGFAHDVLVVDGSGTVRNKALFLVDVEVTVSPESGPVGTPVTIEVRGMGWQSLEDTRTILYDNRYVGFMSAVTTGGTARAVIPATGAPGPHRIEINRGAYTFPYLNPAQSPRPDIPTFEAVFTVTEGDPLLPAPIADQNPAAVTQDIPHGSGDAPAIAADVVSGPVGTPFELRGDAFAPDATVELRWFRIVGNRVSGQGWDEREVVLGEVIVARDGGFTFASEIPGDVGGPHRIEAAVAGTAVAQTSIVITPQADAIPARVRWGQDLGIHLTGVGWTETANIYALVYDNAYVGYACGFNTQGDVLIPLKATGEPGWHFVELYPAIYKGKEKPGRDNFRIPQLTAEDDHPGEDLPVFRFAFLIEEG